MLQDERARKLLIQNTPRAVNLRLAGAVSELKLLRMEIRKTRDIMTHWHNKSAKKAEDATRDEFVKLLHEVEKKVDAINHIIEKADK